MRWASQKPFALLHMHKSLDKSGHRLYTTRYEDLRT